MPFEQQEGREEGDRGDAPRRETRETTPVRPQGDRPQPDGKNRHLRAPRERDRPGERREDDPPKEEDQVRDGAPQPHVASPDPRER